MPTDEKQGIARLDAGVWSRKLHHYCKPDAIRGTRELAITSIPFAIAWFLMLLALENGYLWLYALLLVPAAGFLVRLFMIQHDCGHRSFLTSRRANDWVGRTIGVLTLTPYHTWRRDHAIHHATSGNLDRRGIGDVTTLTVADFDGFLERGGRIGMKVEERSIRFAINLAAAARSGCAARAESVDPAGTGRSSPWPAGGPLTGARPTIAGSVPRWGGTMEL